MDGEARPSAGEVEQGRLHGGGHGRGYVPAGRPARVQGVQSALGVWEADQVRGGGSEETFQRTPVEAMVDAGDGLAVTGRALVLDPQLHGVTGGHRGTGDPQRLGEFGLLESIGSEDGDALSGEVAHGVCSFSGEERPP